MTDTCKSVLTPENNNCPSNGLLKNVPINNGYLAKLTPNMNGSGYMTPTFVYLRTLFENTGYIEYIKHPQKMLDDSSRLPSVEKSDALKLDLPKVFQGLWITNKDNPRIINHQLENFLVQAKKLDSYKAVIWTNIDPDKLKELNPQLEAENVTVKNIADTNTEYTQLLDFVISPKNYLNPSQANHFNGVVIDVAKYIIMESQGGILADLNFKFDNQFEEKNLESYDFIAPILEFPTVENGFFIAKPHHLIFKGTLDIINKMMNNQDCPLRELREVITGNAPVNIFSMMPLTLGYMRYNNLEGNVDSLMSWSCPSNDEKIHSPTIEQIQAHEAMIAKLDSSNLEDIFDYIKSYNKIII